MFSGRLLKMGTGVQYIPLIVAQLVLMGLYFVFVRHPSTVFGDNAPVPMPELTPEPGLGPVSTEPVPTPAVPPPPPPPLRFSANDFDQIQKDFNVKGFQDTHVMIFIGFGFLMTFLKKYCYSALGFNLMLAALSMQWALLCQNFFHMHDGKIILTKTILIEADIMSATVLITFGALLGITSPLQMIFISIVEIAFGCVNIWLLGDKFQAADVGGSMAIHAYGAFFGLGCSLGLRKKKDPAPPAQQTSSGNWLSSVPPEPVNLNAPSYSSDVTAMIGSLFLWIYWPSFNSALTNSEYEYQRAFANTYLSLGAATLTTFFLTGILTKHKELDMVLIQNSTLAGGVGVGAVCNMMIGPGGALAIGIGAGLISVLGYLYITPALNKAGLIDTCGVLNLHGTPGVFAGILSVVFAYLSSAKDYGKDELYGVFPAMSTGRSSTQQALNQLYALLCTLVISIAVGTITGLVARKIKPLKDTEKYDDTPHWELPK